MPNCCLTRLCDMCGKLICGANYHCPRCNICVCFNCSIELTFIKDEYPIKCPMCEEELIQYCYNSSRILCWAGRIQSILLDQKAEILLCTTSTGDCFVSKRRLFDLPECKNCIYKGSNYCWSQCSLNIWKSNIE